MNLFFSKITSFYINLDHLSPGAAAHAPEDQRDQPDSQKASTDYTSDNSYIDSTRPPSSKIIVELTELNKQFDAYYDNLRALKIALAGSKQTPEAKDASLIANTEFRLASTAEKIAHKLEAKHPLQAKTWRSQAILYYRDALVNWEKAIKDSKYEKRQEIVLKAASIWKKIALLSKKSGKTNDAIEAYKNTIVDYEYYLNIIPQKVCDSIELKVTAVYDPEEAQKGCQNEVFKIDHLSKEVKKATEELIRLDPPRTQEYQRKFQMIQSKVEQLDLVYNE